MFLDVFFIRKSPGSEPLKLYYLNFHPLEVASRGNLKRVKITHICLISDQALANINV